MARPRRGDGRPRVSVAPSGAADPPHLLVVRHGESTWNAEHRWAGEADPPLTDRGRSQTRDLGTSLGSVDVTRIISSDQRRALETAELLAERLGIAEVATDERLRERRCPAWSGLTTEEIERRHPGVLQQWRAGALRDLPRPSEPWDGFETRVLAGLHDAVLDGGLTIVATHAGVFRVLDAQRHDPSPRMENATGRWLRRRDDVFVECEPTASMRR